ncbi:hypothetical protein GGQ22_12410 [Nocardioides sp. zg-579]|uniref:Copper chaperone PCu(A)C n=1 Tax=Nocardioides marmotae TaxID=2663857 RepID=A0A6I3JCX3_9ACTN|nr:hypothetical protein [Nocardioides marmotae]MCR6032235.1 hypothetical protein [Gordonia jinghuaiqii]MTB95883.1 hypothetical protein [Nocardioides marmotae]QKE02770.1 hypothetical protein HPC71_18125 [Nocardioides marmotae]
MLLRRNTTLALGALVLTVPVLSSCGFNPATDRVNTISMSGNERSGSVDVIGAVIVSERAGSGTFLTTFSNNPGAEATEIESISAGSGAAVEAAEFEPYALAEGGLVSLLQDGGVRLTGDFDPGDFVPLTIGFSSGEQVSVTVPVVPACDEYDGLDDAPQAAGTAPSDAEPYDCAAVSVEPHGTEGSEAPEAETE